MSVAELVEADPWEVGFGDGPFKRLGQRVWVNHVAVGAGEKRSVGIVSSEFLSLTLPPLTRDLDGAIV